MSLTLGPTVILGAAAPVDDFYLTRLKAGKTEVRLGRHFEAISDFRIASFGFLDQPVLLVEGLARLALVQAAAGRNEDADASLRRFLEVEERFDGWQQADLEPETRTAFTALLTKRMGKDAAQILVVVATAAPAAPTMPPIPAPTVVPAPAATVVPVPAATAAPVAPASVASTAPLVLTESKSLVAQGRYVENLRRLVAAVAADPKDRDLRKALLEGAALTKDWATAVSQLESLRPFRDGEEPFMFYAAVALRETGATTEARDLADRALPRLSRSPFVDFYARKIMETPKK